MLHFDTIDTIPYWYAPVLRSVAGLDGDEFLDEAKRWIVDVWGWNQSDVEHAPRLAQRFRIDREWKLSVRQHRSGTRLKYKQRIKSTYENSRRPGSRSAPIGTTPGTKFTAKYRCTLAGGPYCVPIHTQFAFRKNQRCLPPRWHSLERDGPDLWSQTV